MSSLTVTSEDGAADVLLHTESWDTIARELALLGVRFERWVTSAVFLRNAADALLLVAHRSQIERLKREAGYRFVDVVRVEKSIVDVEPVRSQFVLEHTHPDDEVRFFAEGGGRFHIHCNGHVHHVVCEAGDLIGIPAKVPHWFDLGGEPRFTAIRLLTREDGWRAQGTGNPIAERFPDCESGDVAR